MLERFRQPAEQAEAHQFWGIGLPIGQVEDRREHLQAALELVKDADQDDLDAISLKARIANSLAELLSYGNEEDKSRARELFELSIQLKSREDIRDLNGLAAAHGGLGRLYFFRDDPDLALARKHFEEDLRYSERIGSLAGQTKMHSLLAACAGNESLQDHEKEFERALEHYQASYRLAEEEFDKFFALAGLVECYASLGQHDQAAQHGQLLVELIQSRMTRLSAEERNTNPLAAVPNHCLDSIRKALRQCEICRKSTWHQWLSELIDHNRVSSTGG
jgi:tetratricopeptide (TPR) repeat protein